MPVSEQETFLIIQFSENSDFVQAYLWQGTYEELYKLDHEVWSLEYFLLAPNSEAPGKWGQPLLLVGSNRAVNLAQQKIAHALFHLRGCRTDQRLREIEAIRTRLDQETRQLTEKALPDTPEGNLERLRELGIEPLTPEQCKELRR